MSHIAVPRESANLQPAVLKEFDLVKRQPVDVNQLAWGLDVQLHVVHQIGPTSDEPYRRPLLCGRGSSLRFDRFFDCGHRK